MDKSADARVYDGSRKPAPLWRSFAGGVGWFFLITVLFVAIGVVWTVPK